MPYQHSIRGEFKYENMYLHEDYSVDVLEQIRAGYDMTGDILLASYPKTGTTWMQEMLWLVLNDADVEGAKQIPVHTRSPMIEITTGGVRQLDVLDKKPHPRLIKTHLPARFFEKQLATDLKVVLLIRNPKDTLVSFYHMYRMAEGLRFFPGTWNDFFEMYKEKHILYGDYFDWYREWLAHVGQENVRLFTYENMTKNCRGVLKELSGFVNKDLTDSQITAIEEHTTFNNMRLNDMTNQSTISTFHQGISPFMRKGIVGDWKNHFTQEQSDIVDAACKSTLEPFGFDFQFQ